MPRTWYDKRSIHRLVDESRQGLYKSIAADRKPYFMRYVYSTLAKQYNDYMKRTNKNALREFGISVADLCGMQSESLTDRQMEFLLNYRRFMPVSTNSCVVNRVCRMFEREFDGFVGRISNTQFDASIYSSGAEYTKAQEQAIRGLLAEYECHVRSYGVFANMEKIDKDTVNAEMLLLEDTFRRECQAVCSNEAALCEIILNICYRNSKSKRFAWKMCGEQMIANLAGRVGNEMHVPVLNEEGDISYCGKRFQIKVVNGGCSNGNYSE